MSKKNAISKMNLGEFIDFVQSSLPTATEEDIKLFDFGNHPAQIVFEMDGDNKRRKLVLRDNVSKHIPMIAGLDGRPDLTIGRVYLDKEAVSKAEYIMGQYRARRQQAKHDYITFGLSDHEPKLNSSIQYFINCSWIARSFHWFIRSEISPVYLVELSFDGCRYYTRQNNQNSYMMTLQKPNSDIVVSLYSFIQKKGVVVEAVNRQTKAKTIEVASSIIEMKNIIKKFYSDLSIEDQNVLDEI